LTVAQSLPIAMRRPESIHAFLDTYFHNAMKNNWNFINPLDALFIHDGKSSPGYEWIINIFFYPKKVNF
jgi:hypothetical protein